LKYNSNNNDYCFRDKRFETNKSKNQIENQLNHLNYDRNFLNIVDKTNFLSINHYHEMKQNSDHNINNFLEKKDMFMIEDSRKNLIKFKNDFS
jgi:hypothetical protein